MNRKQILSLLLRLLIGNETKPWYGEFQKEKHIRLGPYPQPPDAYRQGVLVMGQPGSGKSSVIKRYCKDAAWCGDGGCILDVSDEMEHYLKNHGPPNIQVKRVDVHRENGVGLDFAGVLDRKTRWDQFANKICPDLKGDSSPFFRSFARLVLVEALFVLWYWAKTKWLLSDVVKLCTNRNLYSLVMANTPGANDPYNTLQNNDSARDVAGTVLALLSPFSTFASLNDNTTEKVSPIWPLQNPGGWLCLVRDDRATSTVEGVHSLTIDLLAEEALATLDKEKRLHIIGDEARTYQPIKMLSEIVRRGRKSSVCAVLSIHEIDGWYDRMGKELGEEVLALLGHRVFLRTGGVNTAEWASKYLGVPETLVDIPPRGMQEGNYQRHISMRPNVIADQLRHRLRLADWDGDRLEGYLDTPTITCSFHCKFREDVEVPSSTQRKHVPPSLERLGPMTLADLTRLSIPAKRDILEIVKVATP